MHTYIMRLITRPRLLSRIVDFHWKIIYFELIQLSVKKKNTKCLEVHMWS